MPRSTNGNSTRVLRWLSLHPREALVNAARRRAKVSGIDFSITCADLDWPSHCPVLGIPLRYNTTAGTIGKLCYNSATLDRKSNQLGYVVGNVFVISHRANRLKSDATEEEIAALFAYTKA
jgi:hypothetical protein